MTAGQRSWADYVSDETLFSNAIRLRYLIWTIQRYAKPGARLLEAGFGSGTTAVLLADEGYHVTGLDLSEAVVDRVRTRYRDFVERGTLEVCHGDMLDLPWSGGAFDLAYSQGVLEHLQDEEIVRALAEQGRVAECVVFDVPNSKYGERPFGDERLLPERTWRRHVEAAGLKVEQVLGRQFHPWMYLLPYALFSRRGIEASPGLVRRLGLVSIFVCRPR